jgi:tRNA-dihydrouridine synthase
LQAKHGRGSGILSHIDIIKEVSQTIKEHSQLTFSVKMRLGWENCKEWEPVLNILNDTPLTHITLHPRTGIQQYKGDIDYEAFTRFYEECKHPLLYNGDLTSIEQLHNMEQRYPRLAGLMLGRGLLARPSLAKEYTEGREWNHEEHIRCLRSLHEELTEQYSRIVKSDTQLHSKLRTFWEYTEPLIGRKPYKKIMKSGNLRNYMSAIGELR